MALPRKEWWKSKTVWSATGALLVAIATAAWGEASPFTSAVIAILSAAGLYGRLTATTRLK